MPSQVAEMVEIDAIAKARIVELEDLLEDRMVLIDLLETEVEQLRAELKVAKGQYSLLLADYKTADVA